MLTRPHQKRYKFYRNGIEKQSNIFENELVLTGNNPEMTISKDTQSPKYNQIHVDIICALALEITIVNISKTYCKIIFTETCFSN